MQGRCATSPGIQSKWAVAQQFILNYRNLISQPCENGLRCVTRFKVVSDERNSPSFIVVVFSSIMAAGGVSHRHGGQLPGAGAGVV